MEREEILEQIERLKKKLEELNSKFIDFNLPENYDKMSKEEKKAYHKNQEKLKKEALANLDNYSVIMDDRTIVKYPKDKTIARTLKKEVGGLTTIPLERDTFKRTTPEKFKELHKENLEKIEKQIDRFNSTKAIRNDKIEFGSNFLNFAGTYFNKQACDNLENETRKIFLKKYDRQEDKNGNVIGDKFKFQNLTEDQRKDLIKIRIKTFAKKLNRMYEIAEIKVKIDTQQKMNTYLERHGFFNEKMTFRNGTKKFTAVNSVISKSGIDMSKAKNYKSELKSKSRGMENREDKNKSRLIELNVMREKFDKFIKNYRGNGRQFSIEFENNFPEMAQKLYNQKSNGILSFRSQNLSSSPISVQQHEIEKQFDEEFRKANFRLRYASFYIPSSYSASAAFLGKILTNAKSKTEKNLDEQRVLDYEKELKNIALREDLVGYETIINNLNKNLQSEFLKHIKKDQQKFDKKSEVSKKKELKNFISSRIEKLKETVHKNKFFALGSEKLEKLSGVLIDRADRVESREIKNIVETLGQEQGEKYKQLLQSVKDFTFKYNNEKITIDKLSEKLEKLNDAPYSIETNSQIQSLLRDINSHNRKLTIIKASLDNALQRKNVFETNFASHQISKSMKSSVSKALVFNTAKSVFDKYAFPAVDAFGETYYIEKGTLEGKQVEKVVSTFIMNFKNQVQNMKLSFENCEVIEIRDYVERLTDRLDDDFGSNIRDLKKTQKLFISHIEALKKQADSKLRVDLEKYVQRLSKIEVELIKKLKSMNVEIGDVTLIKNKK